MKLTADQTLVFYCFTEKVMADPVQVQLCEEVLSREEQQRRAKFLRQCDRREYLVAHALARICLSRVTGADPRRLTFTTNSYGRPELSGPGAGGGLGFNISHTLGLVACALSRTLEVGVDVEHTNRATDLRDLAESVFSPAEVLGLDHCPLGLRTRFFELWTLKESYIKARGMGLQLPLDKFSFAIEESAVSISMEPEVGDSPDGWCFLLHRPSAQHQLAAATRWGGGEPGQIVLSETMPGHL